MVEKTCGRRGHTATFRTRSILESIDGDLCDVIDLGLLLLLLRVSSVIPQCRLHSVDDKPGTVEVYGAFVSYRLYHSLFTDLAHLACL